MFGVVLFDIVDPLKIFFKGSTISKEIRLNKNLKLFNIFSFFK